MIFDENTGNLTFSLTDKDFFDVYESFFTVDLNGESETYIDFMVVAYVPGSTV
jgi:hypothetical protein